MSIYDRKNPFLAKIKARYSLCAPGSQKNTYHLVLDLMDSGISYSVGDSVAIYPQNDPEVVSGTLSAIGKEAEAMILDKRSQQLCTLHTFLQNKAAITTLSRKLFTETAARQPNLDKKNRLNSLLEDPAQLKAYLETTDLASFLLEHSEIEWEIQELCDFLMPLLPRFYSIASSMKAVGNEIHLTIALPQHHKDNKFKRGVCTYYLCQQAPLNEAIIPLYIQPNHGFTLPNNPSSSLIMIGPGTGIAPFRAFMQERDLQGATGKNWLFFGEWNRSCHFFYEDYWKDLESKGKLRLSLAFSRDQEHKVYVQHQLLEQGLEVFEWLRSGATLFVCGDANRMAKDVEKALLDIFKIHGQFNDTEAEKYLKLLRSEKRYLRDIY